MQKSLTLKLLLILGLALLLWIPITMVSFKVDERQGYQRQAEAKVAHSWTGPQQLISPVLMIPYRIKTVKDSGFQTKTAVITYKNKLRFISVAQLNGDIQVDNSLRKKGIYKIPVYNSNIQLQGVFSAAEIRTNLNELQAEDGFDGMGKAQLLLYFSDMRGIDSTPSLKLNGLNTRFNPSKGLENFGSALAADVALDAIKHPQGLAYQLQLDLRGMSRLSFVPIADSAKLTMKSNWPHPEFVGASLPSQREVTAQGFSASWQTSKYSNNNMSFLKSCFSGANCHDLSQAAAGANFIEPVNIYLQSERSIKYAMLFIGLSFIAFFIFEHIKKTPIHPIQYTFVGLAIAVFYLLLISLAEHIEFHWAYLIGATACSGLLLFYLRFILGDLKSAGLFSSMIIALYSLLYVIVQAEDFALLMGACLVFAVLTGLMVVTRNIDWYGISQNDKPGGGGHNVDD